MPFYSPYSKCNEYLGKYIDNEIVYEDKDFFMLNDKDHLSIEAGKFLSDDIGIFIKNLK